MSPFRSGWEPWRTLPPALGRRGLLARYLGSADMESPDESDEESIVAARGQREHRAEGQQGGCQSPGAST